MFKVLGFLVICMFFAPTVFSQEKFPGVKALMTEEEAKSTGIDRLSEDEIEALNEWLIRFTANDAAILKKNDQVKVEMSKIIRSKIKGDFIGWTGETFFHLENGQVWQQRLSGRWKIKKMVDTEVEISRNIFGFYKLKVLEKNKSIGVKRVK